MRRGTLQKCGSSPPARGRVLDHLPGIHARRVIPACAGKGKRSAVSRPRTPGHPRLRGEGGPGTHQVVLTGGSSPPARGRVIGNGAREEDARVIPACAGKGPEGRWGRHGSAGHPRLRGEGYRDQACTRQPNGSSPPARGRVHSVGSGEASDRVIPACAGKGEALKDRIKRPAGHPRLRGEGKPSIRPRHRAAGSSPPARGRAVDVLAGVEVGRVIPACAGKGGGCAAGCPI